MYPGCHSSISKIHKFPFYFQLFNSTSKLHLVSFQSNPSFFLCFFSLHHHITLFNQIFPALHPHFSPIHFSPFIFPSASPHHSVHLNYQVPKLPFSKLNSNLHSHLLKWLQTLLYPWLPKMLLVCKAVGQMLIAKMKRLF